MLKIKDTITRLYGGEDRFIKILLTLAVLAWLPRLFTPLWRDEAITWWIIKDGWGEALLRATSYQEWSTSYFLLLKALTGAAHSELLLRLPSLASGAVCLRAVYLAGLRLKDSRAGLLSALVLASSTAALQYFNEARAYGPALALSAAAVLFLVRTLDEGRPADAAAYALCAAGAAYMHLTAGLMLLPHALYWAWRRFAARDAAPASRFAPAAAALLMLPLALPALSAFGRRGGLMFAEPVYFLKFLFYALPPDLFLGAAGGLLLAGPALFDIQALRRARGSGLLLAAALALAPLLVFYAMSLAGVHIWLARYFICYELGIALGAGLLLSCVRGAAALRAAAISLTLLSVGSRARLYHIKEDWAGAAAFARRAVAEYKADVLMTCPFVESLEHGWLGDPARESYLASPLAFYPCGVKPALLPMPYAQDNEAALDAAVRRAAGGGAVVFLSLGEPVYDSRMQRRLLAAGLKPGGRLAGNLFPRAYLYVRNGPHKR